MTQLLYSRTVWCLVGVLVGMALVADAVNSVKFGGIDLRNRVIGARLILAGRDPYRYMWQPADPQQWCDPFIKPGRVASRVTVTPTSLMLYVPLATLHYQTQRIIWLLLHWACLAAVGLIFVGAARTGQQRRAILMGLLVLFVIGEAWRMHVEKGQVYVVYALLLAMVWWIGRAESARTDWPAGLLLGIAVALRPVFVLMVIPFLVARRWRVLAGAAAGVLAGVGVSLLLVDWSHWRSFFATMEAIGSFYVYPDAVPQWWHYPEAFPETIEGMQNLASWRGGDPDSVRMFKLFGWIPSPHGTTAMKVCCAVTLGATCWFVFRRWRPPVGFGTCLIAGLVLACIADFFIPAPRNAYVSVFWVVPMGVLLVEQWGSPILRGSAVVVLIVGLAVANGVLPTCRSDPIGFGSIALIVCLALMCATLGRQGSAPSEST